MTPDSELLHRYAERGDEVAFGELVRRHLDLVYSVALRRTAGDSHLAQDAAQVVFTDLARKARTFGPRKTLAGWLHTSARFAASKAVRSQQRRRMREQEALIMHENRPVPEINWAEMRPLLDESVGQLDDGDRDAIVLRFFQGKSHREVGAILGLSENSANKRVERALEKLRNHFARRGVTVPSALLASTIGANSVEAVPLGLAANVTRTSLVGVSNATLGAAWLTALFMNSKTKIIVIAVILLLLAVTVTIIIRLHPEPESAIAVSRGFVKKSAPSAIKPLPIVAHNAAPAAPAAAPPSPESPVSISSAEPNEAAQAGYAYLAKAYADYMVAGGTLRMLTASPGDTAHAAALELAINARLNDASFYFQDGDPLGPKPRPQKVIDGDPHMFPPLNPAFANATLSVVMVANILPGAGVSVTTTPIIWTRGLRDDGTWSSDSPYGGKGGYIAFLDGHVEWVEKLSVDSGFNMINPLTLAKTVNIREALPAGAVILPAEPKHDN